MPKQFIIKTTLLILFTAGLNVGTINCAFARWATPNDAALEVTKITQDIVVNKNGSSRKTYELEAKILKESEKAEWANHTLEYNANTSQMKVLEAKTIVNGQAYPVAARNIQDKPIASDVQAFDQKNQITIPFPHIDVNAIVHLKTQTINTNTQIDNFYSSTFVFGDYGYSKSETVSIRSELPLYIEIHDPDQILSLQKSIRKEKNKTFYLIKITQNKPLIKYIVDESPARLNLRHLPIVAVSTMNTWDQYGKALALEYEKIRRQPLPALYQEIADIAKTKKTNIEKINTVTSLLAEKINYLMDMRTIKGRIIPQALQNVENTRLGDCKDFSMATAVILQKIGIPSQVAIVMRGETALPLPIKLPGVPGHFNHAMVKVALPEGTLWIDPTNMTSMANHIFPDISNRSVLILDPHHSSYETIPVIKAENQQFIREETWDMTNPDALQIKGQMRLLGGLACLYTGSKNNLSEESIKQSFLHMLNDRHGHVLHHQITLPDLSSRIVEDLTFDYALTSRHSGLNTNAGIAIPLTFKPITPFLTKKETVSDIYVGTPRILDSYLTIKNISPTGKQSLDCTIESPWVNISRKVTYQTGQVFIHQKMEIKQSWITGESLASKEYKQLQDAIEQNFSNGIAIVVAPKA